MALTNAQYDEIMREYQRRQNQVREALSAREREAYERIPELAGLDERIASESTAYARVLLAEDGTAEGSPAPRSGGESSMAPLSDEAGKAGGPAISRDSESRLPEDTARFQNDGHSRADLPAKDDRAGNHGAAHSQPPGISALKARIEEISSQKERLLKMAGFPKGYLEPEYFCADCQDTGYIGREKCHCFRQASIDLLYAQSNLRRSMQGETFSAFSLDYYPKTMTDPVTGLTAAEMARRALQECRHFVKDFDREPGNLFLSGDTGLGKTFLSHCVANALLESTHSVVYFSAFRLFELLADASFGRTDENEAGEMDRYIYDCDLLIIDDLGTEMTNSFVASELFLVLNERILRRKSTMISTNLSLASIADLYSERVLSRISSNYRMLRLIGDDIRIQKRIHT
ncbi:MAG: ATP-binding protein [Lachnospiraceae bacterium]|nr:ATP-binding protein [Lachnospiraceae bacterium]